MSAQQSTSKKPALFKAPVFSMIFTRVSAIVFTIVFTIVVAGLAAGCATKRETGALTGAATGTAAGAAIGDTEAAVIGGLLGTIVGHEIGYRMQREDRQRTRDVLEHNQTGQSSDWVNPDTGRRYAVTPRVTYRGARQRPCREFVIEWGTGPSARKSVESACRRPDGTWQIMN